MWKIIFIYLISLFFLFNLDGLAQVHVNQNVITVNLENTDPPHNTKKKGKFKVRNYFQYTDISKSGYFNLPLRKIILAIPPNSKPNLKLKNYELERIKNVIPAINPDVKKVNDSTLSYIKQKLNKAKTRNKENIIEINRFFWLRDFYCAEIIIRTHSFESGTNTLLFYEQVEFELNFPKKIAMQQNFPIKEKSSFDRQLKNILFNHSMAEQFRTAQKQGADDSVFDWINFGQNYLKIGTKQNNLHRVSYSHLSNYGVNVNSINPNTFQLFESGDEIPIFIADGNDGYFDQGDYLDFYGTKNYSKTSHRIINQDDENYNLYLDRYTDTTYYFLTWNGEQGNRIIKKNSPLNNGLDTLDYYTEIKHFEENTMYQNLNNNEVANQKPNWNKNKSWYWRWVFTNQRNFSFNVTDLYPDKNANIFFKLVSAGSNVINDAHQVIMKVNGEQVDSQSVDRFDQVLLQAELSSNDLGEGSNQISVRNFDNGTVPNFLAVDWFDVEYPRKLSLVSDSLIFKVPEGVQPGEKIIKIENASSQNYLIYRISPDTVKFNNYEVTDEQLFFADTVQAGNKYIVIKKENTVSPEFEYLKEFEDLTNSSYQADYITITHPKFEEVGQNYTNTIANLYDLNTKLVTVDDIFDQFGYGYPTPEAVKKFVKAAYQEWQEPKPTYLTLIGDASYDYHDYVYENVGVKLSYNYVPSYGNPVGDNWYATWGDSPIPQMEVGRIPITESSQLSYYLSKVQNNYNAGYDDWNKRYLFFSGGRANQPSELELYKSVNDEVIDNLIEPRPVAGNYTHFYKTSDPLTDFGPYTQEEIETAISNGGLFISYIGHSGTATWDNSINETRQLENDVNRNPLITDFGCSTNKFAEPDIIAFGERFLFNDDGQAIGYIGNSSLGFSSTATTIPDIFYKHLIEDSLHTVGSAHLLAKAELLTDYGSSEVNKVFSLTNTLLADPAVRIKIPDKPNLTISQNDFGIEENISEVDDFTNLDLIVRNNGKAPSDSFTVKIAHLYRDSVIERKSFSVLIPEFSDTISTSLSTGNKAGLHEVSVTYDSSNAVAELYENDNQYNFSFNVYASSVRDMLLSGLENPKLDSLILLNPGSYGQQSFNIDYQVSEGPSFDNYDEYSAESGSFYSKLNLPVLSNNKRYWLRYKIDEQENFSRPVSFFNESGSKFYLSDSVSLTSQNLNKTEFKGNSIQLSKDSVEISVLSAGFYAGATCVIAKNSINLLSNSFFAGMGIVVFDPVSIEVDTTDWFWLFDNAENADSLTALINSIPEGKIVAMGVADDGQHRLDAELKAAIKTLGSTKIDSLVFRGSWGIIGVKGAQPGDAIENVNSPYEDAVSLDTTYQVKNQTGTLVTKKIGPVNEFQNLKIYYENAANSELKLSPIVYNTENIPDTLGYFDISDSTASLQGIDTKQYPFLQLMVEFTAGDSLVSPELHSLGVNYSALPELGANYQVVSTSTDSVFQGDSLDLDFSIYNAGETAADSVSARVSLLNSSNEKLLLDTVIQRINSSNYENLTLNYDSNFDDGYGAMKFGIQIDSENKIREVYEDNNYYEQNYYVIKDTVTSATSARIGVTFNGREILDGEYISDEPEIKMELNYNSDFPDADTNAVKFYLNNKVIGYDNLTINYDTNHRKNVYKYEPNLESGEYTFRIEGDDLISNNSSNYAYEKRFVVAEDAKILNVYNYPNPIKHETYFTFKLTQKPDKLKIFIYTISGRLVRKINVNAAELNYDFNKIFWDGKDQDGDELANGTYLYRIVITDEGETKNVTNKLAILR